MLAREILRLALFDLMLKRLARWQGQGLSPAGFATRRHFEALA
jgi:hypothetical protein